MGSSCSRALVKSVSLDLKSAGGVRDEESPVGHSERETKTVALFLATIEEGSSKEVKREQEH